MEQDCVAGLFQPVGMSLGAEFSPEDVSFLFEKMFHVPSSVDEAHMAMKKIAGGNSSWSCFGENVLDVLLEMDREKEKQEKLHWDLQMLNVGNLNNFYVLDQSVINNPCVLNGLHQNAVGKLNGSVRVVKRLKKAARQCWARLATESVTSLLPSPWQGPCSGFRGQALGFVSLTDVLLLLEVKYDVVTHLLYTEMLQEHYTPSIWETLLPWQQHEEEEGLEDLADEALGSGDMLCLAELPGAFRIYRACLSGHPERRETSWSAVSLLYEFSKSRQQERDTITALAERLDRQSLRLLCLYISLATLRAQREKRSYSALLAARQSWETWPHVKSPCRAEQAALWLHDEEEEQRKGCLSDAPQQAVLQLLVLAQEQERKHLVKLAKGISIEDLQEPGCKVPPKEDHLQAALRSGFIKRLRQIHAGLQTCNDIQAPLKQTNLQQQIQSQLHMGSKPAVWYQHHLEECSLLLLTHLMEVQELQASALLSALMDESAAHVQALRDDYASELQAQSYTNLLQLISETPFTSDSLHTPYPNLPKNSSNEQITSQSYCSGLVDIQNSSCSSADAQTGANGELNVMQAEEPTEKQDVCTGCGAVMEDLPYLEILCAPDSTSTHHTTDRESREEENAGATKSPQSYEKQGSLIAVAWSKPLEDDTDEEEVAAVGVTGQSQDVQDVQDVQSSTKSSTAEHTQCEETYGESDRVEMKPRLFHSDSTDHDEHAADQQCSTVEQMTVEGRAESGSDLQAHALVAETQQAEHILDEQPAGDSCSDLENGTANVAEELELEKCPTATDSELWDQRGPENAEQQNPNSQVALDCSPAEREPTLMERDRAREPVSAMERERTMRNLVDMQRKVEQRQQRDRERQLLRVQERLSIIQNRKAEEDLLGLKHSDRLRHLMQDLPQEDKNQQKTVVRERLEQLRRERSYAMQSKRDRNTAGFKELLAPVALHSRDTDDGAD